MYMDEVFYFGGGGEVTAIPFFIFLIWSTYYNGILKLV
jgi:hypothetical protein